MVIEKQRKNIFKAKQTKQKAKPKKIKSFEEYFQECINNKTIPADTPPYLKKKSINKELRKRNQLLKILLRNMLSMENQLLFQLTFL